MGRHMAFMAVLFPVQVPAVSGGSGGEEGRTLDCHRGACRGRVQRASVLRVGLFVHRCRGRRGVEEEQEEEEGYTGSVK